MFDTKYVDVDVRIYNNRHTNETSPVAKIRETPIRKIEYKKLHPCTGTEALYRP